MLRRAVLIFVVGGALGAALLGLRARFGGSDEGGRRWEMPADWRAPSGWRAEHPRLPGPDAAWIAELKRDRVRLDQIVKAADALDASKASRGTGGIREVAIAWLATRQPRYLEKVGQLAQRPFRNFGVQAQLYTVAMLYDWLHADLDEATRKTLQDRLLELCARWKHLYLEGWRVSPYNAIAYARLGAGIWWGAAAIHPDRDEAAPYVAFAEHVLSETYLPVWRQIMDGGGWHEGAEYVDLGIGRTVFLALSAWGRATGRDLFAENAWLGDLVYYPIYTTRPDGTPFRLGDVAWGLTRSFPEFLPLSVVYENPYGLHEATGGRHPPANPTAWPWGPPVPRQAVMKPASELPLQRHFPGWGTVMMRSDWTEDATFASFHAGDHYWSHQNFDSGAFTIYKRGALAIDSGAYGVGYNAEHHAMYGMQAIAHNLVTVTDPADPSEELKKNVYLTPKRRGMVAFPNDGGHRRVGSTYTPAPMNLEEWEKRRDEFEMGDILAYEAGERFVCTVADTTAAYNNAASATDPSPLNRTRRVSRCRRSFVFLRPDFFVVYDEVDTVSPEMTVRWLLHGINEPMVKDGVVVFDRTDAVQHKYAWPNGLRHRTKDRRYYRYGGRLFLRSLGPEGARIATVGGPGHEFDVGGRNYAGAQQYPEWMTPDPRQGPAEPGAWRIEVTAPGGTRHRFLHVLQATTPATETMVTSARLDATEGGAPGVAFVDAAGIGRHVLFVSPGPDPAPLVWVAPGGVALETLVVGLAPETSWTWTRTPVAGMAPEPRSLRSGPGGTLFLSTPAGSQATWSLVPDRR